MYLEIWIFILKELNGGRALNFVTEKAFDTETYYDWKGKFNLEKMEDFIKEKGAEKIAFIFMTITCNSAGGEPVSMVNLRATSALAKRNKKHGDIIGLIPIIGSLGIALGYSVVVGWILRFTIGGLIGSLIKSTESVIYFQNISGKFGSIGWHILALALTFTIMVMGVSKGIEKVNKFMMPAFFYYF